MRFKPTLLMLILLLGQTTTPSWFNDTVYSLTMLNLIQTIMSVLILVVIPILLIYGLLKSTMDVFKGVRVLKLLPILFIAQTTTTPIFEQALKNIADFYDTLISGFITIFFILLPTTLFLLLWKAFTKLIRL